MLNYDEKGYQRVALVNVLNIHLDFTHPQGGAPDQ